MRKGGVSLVGAGPGDPGLLTVKALRRIREADLIVYDYLANPQHLLEAKPGAETVCVGKDFRNKRLTQEKINRLILGAAEKGLNVVRLKGGDPYLFGRGGEEALWLRKKNIPFEVVPGVTSAVACAAYAGIPLTHRDHNASVTFLTGHRADDGALDTIDWKKIVSLGGTIAIYMGFYNLGKICKKLIDGGMKPAAKIAVIEWGTLPHQKSCHGTLATIERLVKQKELKPPCMIVVGDVVSLAGDLNWFEKRPLFGQKVLVTRTREKSRKLAEKLDDAGAAVLEWPAIEIVPVSGGALDEAVRSVARQDWAVFTSTYGVEAFFRSLERQGKDARALGSVKVASVGPEVSACLKKYGVKADMEPVRFESRAIADAFEKKFGRLDGRTIVLFRTDIAPLELDNDLKRLGATVRRVNAYKTVEPKAVSEEVLKAWEEKSLDWVTFTSASTVKNFVKMLGPKNVKAAASRLKFASIGPVTSAALKEFGLKPACEAKVYTIDGLVAAMSASK